MAIFGEQAGELTMEEEVDEGRVDGQGEEEDEAEEQDMLQLLLPPSSDAEGDDSGLEEVEEEDPAVSGCSSREAAAEKRWLVGHTMGSIVVMGGCAVGVCGKRGKC